MHECVCSKPLWRARVATATAATAAVTGQRVLRHFLLQLRVQWPTHNDMLMHAAAMKTFSSSVSTYTGTQHMSEERVEIM